MSLLNDVMRDLQTRGVLGVPPLAGLQPVSGVPAQHRKRQHLLPALAALTAITVVLVWQPLGDSGWLPSISRDTGVLQSEGAPVETAAVEYPVQAELTVAANGDDLRELFPIESEMLTPEVVDVAAEPLAEMRSEPLAMADVPETKQVIETPGTPPEVERPTVESKPVTQAPAPTNTTITRRELGAIDVEGMVSRASQSMRSRDFTKAERLLRDALAIEPGNAETWSFLYGVLISGSRPVAAEQALQQGLALADDSAPLAKIYAKSLLDRGDRNAALGILAAHRPTPASDTEYDAFLAALLQQSGQYAEAGEIYQTLLTINPNSGDWLVGLAMSHDSLGFRDEALLVFERALTSGSLKSPLDRYARRRTAELKAL